MLSAHVGLFETPRFYFQKRTDRRLRTAGDARCKIEPILIRASLFFTSHSAKTGEGIHTLFDDIAQLSLRVHIFFQQPCGTYLVNHGELVVSVGTALTYGGIDGGIRVSAQIVVFAPIKT